MRSPLVLLLALASLLVSDRLPALAQTAAAANGQDLCPTPALKRLQDHRVGAGETLASIAQRYALSPQTLMSFNPTARSGQVSAGQTLTIPPHNGIRVTIAPGKTWRDLAQQYSVQADVLFEINGCREPEGLVFVPGVNWAPGVEASRVSKPEPQLSAPILANQPLAKPGAILVNYGWQLQPSLKKVSFHGGIDLAAQVGETVLATGAGTVAFSGNQVGYGQLVVINHGQGLQTRYAHLSKIQVQVGQRVEVGEAIGQVGQTGDPSTPEPHLHYEVRLNSKVGWVAQDPNPYLRSTPTVGTRP